MEGSVLTTVILPLILAVVMLGMGLSLVASDFKRVLKSPKAFAIGIICQMILLPAIGFGIAYALNLPPILAVGLIILALCPGGVTSNMYSYLAKGDVALSISLTAMVSLITPFTIPIFAAVAMNQFMGGAEAFSIPLGKTIVQLMAITILPVGIGMAINRKWPDFAGRCEKSVKIFSIVALALIILGIMLKNKDNLGSFFVQVGWAAFTLNVVSMAVGFAIANAMRLSRKENITIGIEVGLQNGTMALVVVLSILAPIVGTEVASTMAIPAATYSIIMFGTAALFLAAIKRFDRIRHLYRPIRNQESHSDQTGPSPLTA